MLALCSKLAYYAGIMLNALACLLCIKLCRNNRRRPSAWKSAFSDLVTITHGNYVKNTYILVAYRIILCPDITADYIAGMVFITAVMSLDSVPVLPFSLEIR